jgi:hypothetical protein
MRLVPIESVEVDENGVGWEVRTDHAYYLGRSRVPQTTKTKQIPVEVTNYRCPVCGHDKYEPIFFNPYANQAGGFQHSIVRPVIGPAFKETLLGREYLLVITEYRCPSCTIRFEDPVKFSANKPAAVVPPTARKPENPYGIEHSEEETHSMQTALEGLPQALKAAKIVVDP